MSKSNVLRLQRCGANACFLAALASVVALAPTFALAQEQPEQSVQLSTSMGEMRSTLSASLADPAERLRFEPYDMAGDLGRDDIVLLMRHGPTDWSRLDAPGVEPNDCASQRMLSSEGREDMRSLGVLMADNGIRPSSIVVSEWCRVRDTADELIAGFAMVDPDYANSVQLEIDPAANLLLTLRGAPHVTELRREILAWQGDEKGPLLIISHFTNIAEVTQFDVYEGEVLVIDPQRDGRVLGYLRLASAGPDVGHFKP